MDDGVIDVKLCPEWKSPSIHRALRASLSKRALLQGAVAYWTVPDGLLGNKVSPALKHESAFMCVDIHLPTDIDALADLARSGAHVRLFCEEIATYADSGRKEPPCLLHPKMLLFWSPDKTAELWVGSHNWTRRAIFGLNVEYSVVLTLKDTSRLFCEAAEYLQQIKTICEPFDLGRVEYYKELQKNIDERTVPVIEVEARGADRLGQLEVTIFGTDARDLKELGTVRRKAFLSATENDGNEAEFLYPASITQVGELNSSNPTAGKLSFSPRRYAYRVGRRFPELLTPQEIGSSVLSGAQYYVTLELQERDVSLAFDYPRARMGTWELADEDSSPLIRRLEGEEISTLFRGRPPRVKIPTVIETQTSQSLTLYERRSQPERSFLTKRVVRRG
jgi:hypothetical protein